MRPPPDFPPVSVSTRWWRDPAREAAEAEWMRKANLAVIEAAEVPGGWGYGTDLGVIGHDHLDAVIYKTNGCCLLFVQGIRHPANFSSVGQAVEASRVPFPPVDVDTIMVTEIGFPWRVESRLLAAGYLTLGDLLRGLGDVGRMRGIGVRSMRDVAEAIARAMRRPKADNAPTS